VRIPTSLRPSKGDFPLDSLSVCWEQDEQPGSAVLKLQVMTADRFLPPSAAFNVEFAPLPAAPLPAAVSKVRVTGAGPIWLHMAYSRWLRGLPEVEYIAVWSARDETYIAVHSHRARQASRSRA
jgi:hypothetical protein